MTLEDRLRQFDSTRHTLLAEMDATDPAHLVARPLEGKWSMIEIVEHLVIAEREIFGGLPDPARLEPRPRPLGDRIRYQIVMAVLRNGIRVRTPSPTMVPQGARGLAELRQLWDENQLWLRSAIDHFTPLGLQQAVFVHPIAGGLTIPDAVALGEVHVAGHIRQIRTLQKLLSAKSTA